MSISDIITAVRYCIDEQVLDNSDFHNASANDNTYMDNIIKSKIGDALRWVCLYAPADLLSGNDGSTATGILQDGTQSASSGICTTINVPADFIKIVRVRGAAWHRAVMSLISEDSEEYLQLRDANGAAATADRPQAALIESAQRKIECYPVDTISYTYVKDPTVGVTYGDSSTPLIPDKVKTAFIYYLTFLLLSAYGDERAPRMLDIAKMNIGRNG